MPEPTLNEWEEYLKERPLHQAIEMSPVGFGNAPRGADPMGPTGAISNTYQPSPQAQALGKVIEVLQDPRNSWMGMGPLAGVVKGPGWGAEVLRRYKLLGGTPETLNKALMARNAMEQDRTRVVRNFRQATDLAAPAAEGPLFARLDPQASTMMALRDQREAMNKAGETYQGIIPSHPQVGSRTAGEVSAMKERIAEAQLRAGVAPETVNKRFPYLPGSGGGPAYEAISRQVARMLDSPGFQFKKPADLPVVAAKQYEKEFPIRTAPLEIHPDTPVSEVYRRYGRTFGLDSPDSPLWTGIERRQSPTGSETNIVRERRRGYPGYEEE